MADAFLYFFSRLEIMVCKYKKYWYFWYFWNIFDKICHFVPGIAFFTNSYVLQDTIFGAQQIIQWVWWSITALSGSNNSYKLACAPKLRKGKKINERVKKHKFQNLRSEIKKGQHSPLPIYIHERCMFLDWT